MRQLDVYIEISGQEYLAGSIRGDGPSDAVFSYDFAFSDQGKAISVHLPLRKEAFSPDETRCFFEGLLPEGFSRKTVASWLRADEEDYLTILSELGKECLGAIRIEENENRHIEEPRYVLLSLDEVRRLAAEGFQNLPKFWWNLIFLLPVHQARLVCFLQEINGISPLEQPRARIS